MVIAFGYDSTSTKFLLFSTGSTSVASTVSVDTLPHVAELWWTGSVGYLSVDGEVPVSIPIVPALSGTGPMQPRFTLQRSSGLATVDAVTAIFMCE